MPIIYLNTKKCIGKFLGNIYITIGVKKTKNSLIICSIKATTSFKKYHTLSLGILCKPYYYSLNEKIFVYLCSQFHEMNAPYTLESNIVYSHGISLLSQMTRPGIEPTLHAEPLYDNQQDISIDNIFVKTVADSEQWIYWEIYVYVFCNIRSRTLYSLPKITF